VALNYARFHGGSWNVLDEEITRLEAHIVELQGALRETLGIARAVERRLELSVKLLYDSSLSSVETPPLSQGEAGLNG